MTSASIVARLQVVDVFRAVKIPPPADSSKLTRCPLPGHQDGTPSFRVFARGWCCFGCGRKGGVLDLVIALGRARDRRGAAAWLEGRLG